jgi:hypothetical protein
MQKDEYRRMNQEESREEVKRAGQRIASGVADG